MRARTSPTVAGAASYTASSTCFSRRLNASAARDCRLGLAIQTELRAVLLHHVAMLHIVALHARRQGTGSGPQILDARFLRRFWTPIASRLARCTSTQRGDADRTDRADEADRSANRTPPHTR